MELYIYDAEPALLGVIDQITSLIWARRYWSVGDFKLLAPLTELNIKLLQKGNLIMKKGDRAAGEIEYIKFKKNIKGMEEIEAQGKFTTAWLGRRIMTEQIITTDTSQNIVNRIVAENIISPKLQARKIPLLELEANPPDLESGMINFTSEPFVTCQLAAENTAKAAKLGFEIQTDIRQKKHIFRVYKGRDLTADQRANHPCIFAQEFDNIRTQEFENSVENLRNVCYVGGEEVNNSREVVLIGTTSGLDRKEVFIDASDITQTYVVNEVKKTMSLEEYLAMLSARGESELEQYAEVLSFSSQINPRGSLKYKEDFDVGDRVTCLNKRWGVKINARITEIVETYQQNGSDIEVTFGESLPTLFDKINKMR